ncbi:beta-N-acetylhexosaminidase [Bdellovibrionota bacterium FG-2]
MASPTLSATTQKAIQQLGEVFLTGFSGLELSPKSASFLKEKHIGGVLLFAHNYDSPAQVAELINQVQELKSYFPLWIAVDHEGGRVQRFKKGFTRIPEAAAIGHSGSPKLAYEISEMMARELKAVGVNLNFAPVVDIATNPKNPVIANRAYGQKEDDVSKISSAVVRGHLTAGVQPCVKHFPGHGDTSTDSHFALPRVDTDLETLEAREFRPFSRAFRSHCAFVMTAHILMPKLDPKFPATLSPTILRELLRKKLRYNRVIVTDDMEMKAITDHYGAEDAPRLALEAGCDLLIYRSENAARIAYEALQKALETGKLKPELVLESVERLRTLKKDVLLPYNPSVVSEVSTKIGTPENLKLVEQLKA